VPAQARKRCRECENGFHIGLLAASGQLYFAGLSEQNPNLAIPTKEA